MLHAAVKADDPKRVKGFSRACVELALGSYPGFTLTAPPSDGTPVGVYRPAFVAQSAVPHTAVLPDGSSVAVAPPEIFADPRTTYPAPAAPIAPGATHRAALGTVAGARSGDKGGDANLGVWARTDAVSLGSQASSASSDFANCSRKPASWTSTDTNCRTCAR